MRRNDLAAILVAGLLATSPAPPAHGAAPLPSWNDGPARTAIVAFVDRVTKKGSPDFVPAPERIAVFDNDGTLWSEQPMYVQASFVLDRVRALAPAHPEWKTQEPFASVLKGDPQAVLAGGEHALVELLMATHAGMTTEEFEAIVKDWLATARHPKTGRPYTEMVYQPMLELLDYLRAKGFQTWIVSGGGVEFMRPWTETVYGIPPAQVVGSSIRTRYESRDGKPAIVRLPEMDFVDDKAGKPVGIHRAIGRRPILAGGNSDGDFEMLEWTTSAPGARLGFIVRHDDAAREVAYDRESHIGRLERGLDEAPKRGWTIVSMKDDWKTVFKPAAGPGGSGAGR
jgi:phosphoglycolate phosphatase-like HAD superfamily hydrolase